jgi:hypothetical protein
LDRSTVDASRPAGNDVEGRRNPRYQETVMKVWVAAILCFTLPIVVLASDGSYKIIYDGGSVQDGKLGVEAQLYIDRDQIRLAQRGQHVLSIPASLVTGIGYGQNVHRKIGTPVKATLVGVMVDTFMAVSKSKRDYIGLTWTEDGKKRGIAMQCDKNEYGGVLSGLEEVTGKQAVNWDTTTVEN